ncbi:MAG: DUF362 domain-containing protein [Fibrobacter sp.]|nr:DUF362 domain-containing protein [Fibrobacter sp.]
MDRRDFLKTTAGVGAGAFAVSLLGAGKAEAAKQIIKDSSASNVYYSKEITPEALLKLYEKVKQNISGKVAIKLHTGEKNGPNILPRDLVKAFQAAIPQSTIVETNTYYHPSDRDTTEKHLETLKVNGWTFCPVDIMDADGSVMLPVKGGKHFKEMSVGKNMLNYDSMIVLTHFKGHTMGGFGGSLKNIAIGCADGLLGKKMIHEKMEDSDFTQKPELYPKWSVSGKRFMEAMADSGKATCDFFKGKMCFINVLRNMSVDCDCAGIAAEPPKCRDLGILASTDILAVDQASIDMVYKLPPKELHDLKERIESREGLHQLPAMESLGMGKRKYKLIEI